jgi:hypothetical protein
LGAIKAKGLNRKDKIDTGNIGYTGRKKKIEKSKGTIKNGQSRDTGNIGYAGRNKLWRKLKRI